jgi:hypothetical protein
MEGSPWGGEQLASNRLSKARSAGNSVARLFVGVPPLGGARAEDSA